MARKFMPEAYREKRLTFRRFAQRIRVPAGFALAPLLLISARPTIASITAGAAVSIIGLIIRAWASGCLRKNQELATSGPYARTRNPLYLGTFILGTGIAVSSGAPWFVALFMALYLMIYVPVMLAEAETMRHLFPKEYEHYSQHVPLFLPRLSSYRAPGVQSGDSARRDKSFDTSRYLKHREYRAAMGLAVIYALLAAKFFLINS